MTAQPKSTLRRWMPLIVFALLAAFLAIGLTLNPTLVPSPLIGKPAPAFELPLLNRDGTMTQEDLKGDVTLLNVFASWCFACRQEHEAITALSNSGIRVIGFNYKDERSDAIAWLRQYGNPYNDIVSDLDGRVGIDWGVYGAPETFVIDSNGIIRDKHVGPVTEDYINSELIPLLRKLRADS